MFLYSRFVIIEETLWLFFLESVISLHQNSHLILQEKKEPSFHVSGNFIIFTMATKIKGICKGFKFISQIFVVKEREMEIGYPTDVKHVAHVGLDGTSDHAPSWMNDFKTAPEFSKTTLGNARDPNSVNVSSWSSQDFDESSGLQAISNSYSNNINTPSSEIPKKSKRKKKTRNSSPTSSTSSSRFSFAMKPKPTPNLQV